MPPVLERPNMHTRTRTHTYMRTHARTYIRTYTRTKKPNALYCAAGHIYNINPADQVSGTVRKPACSPDLVCGGHAVSTGQGRTCHLFVFHWLSQPIRALFARSRPISLSDRRCLYILDFLLLSTVHGNAQQRTPNSIALNITQAALIITMQTSLSLPCAA